VILQATRSIGASMVTRSVTGNWRDQAFLSRWGLTTISTSCPSAVLIRVRDADVGEDISASFPYTPAAHGFISFAIRTPDGFAERQPHGSDDDCRLIYGRV
jgi:hypothetical protein